MAYFEIMSFIYCVILPMLNLMLAVFYTLDYGWANFYSTNLEVLHKYELFLCNNVLLPKTSALVNRQLLALDFGVQVLANAQC